MGDPREDAQISLSSQAQALGLQERRRERCLLSLGAHPGYRDKDQHVQCSRCMWDPRLFCHRPHCPLDTASVRHALSSQPLFKPKSIRKGAHKACSLLGLRLFTSSFCSHWSCGRDSPRRDRAWVCGRAQSSARVAVQARLGLSHPTPQLLLRTPPIPLGRPACTL